MLGVSPLSRSPCAGGRARSVNPTAASTTTSAGSGPKAMVLSAAVIAKNAPHPKIRLAPQGTRLARCAYTTMNASSDTMPSNVPAAASAANARPWLSANTSRIGPATTGSPPTTPPILAP